MVEYYAAIKKNEMFMYTTKMDLATRKPSKITEI